ncbi:hypothetical protein ACXPWS_16295 [Mycobacterium sp. BMJ-28]
MSATGCSWLLAAALSTAESGSNSTSPDKVIGIEGTAPKPGSCCHHGTSVPAGAAGAPPGSVRVAAGGLVSTGAGGGSVLQAPTAAISITVKAQMPRALVIAGRDLVAGDR